MSYDSPQNFDNALIFDAPEAQEPQAPTKGGVGHSIVFG